MLCLAASCLMIYFHIHDCWDGPTIESCPFHGKYFSLSWQKKSTKEWYKHCQVEIKWRERKVTLTTHLTGLGITFLGRFFFIQGKLKLGKEMQVGARQWETTPSNVINVLPSYLKGKEGLRKILLIKNGFILKLHINVFVPEPEQNVREFWQKLHETGLFFHKNTNRVNRNPYMTTAKINCLKLKMYAW